eukprot:scaffold73910_cov37-Attheya_sp.AAC.5
MACAFRCIAKRDAVDVVRRMDDAIFMARATMCRRRARNYGAGIFDDRSEAGSSLMDLLSVDSGETNGESSARSTRTPPAGTQKRLQKKMSKDQVRIVLEAFYNEARVIDSKLSINKFADCRSIPRGTFKGILNLSGLGKLFTTGALLTESSFVVQQKITEQHSRNEAKWNKQNHNNFLTEDGVRGSSYVWLSTWSSYSNWSSE